MFKTRLLSGIVLVIILITTVGLGGNVLFGVLALISLIGMYELYRVFKIENKLPGIIGYLAAIGYYAAVYFHRTDAFQVLSILFLILVMAAYVFTFPKYHSEQIMAAYFGLFYVAVMLSFVYMTRMLPAGNVAVWLIFLSSWGCDTSAYCVGVLIGKHKMAPKLSPKKSIEGGVGGILGAALLGAVFAAAASHFGYAGADPLSYALICGAGGMISQIGDLAASAIKRNKDIKDYGTLIPGHGGILDRFDSVIITAPVIYYLMVMLVH